MDLTFGQSEIFAPAVVVAALYFVTLIRLMSKRIPAINAAKLQPDELKTSSYRQQLAANVDVPAQPLTTLTEFPPLFLILAVMFYVTGNVDDTVMWMAWGYAGLRIIHSAIHLGYNNPMHRAIVYLLSMVILLALWIKFALDVVF